jgi:hypothetical protein
MCASRHFVRVVLAPYMPLQMCVFSLLNIKTNNHCDPWWLHGRCLTLCGSCNHRLQTPWARTLAQPPWATVSASPVVFGAQGDINFF